MTAKGKLSALRQVLVTRYAERVSAERRFFDTAPPATELPDIYHYWSNRYLRPKLETLGFSTPQAMFHRYLAEAYKASEHRERRFVSIGTGNCETEIALAEALVRAGHADFVIECLDLNANQLQAGAALAAERGVSRHIVTAETDVNQWTPARTYDGVLANQSLHHVQNLEGLFDGIEGALTPNGVFVTSDMVGRNGHMRWPEALSIVEEFWRELPKAYTWNHLLRRFEKRFDNWDCSANAFEGIRAQDILPLLLKHFDFDVFVPFANVVDVFIDRSFGPNFSTARPWDADFIDRVARRDEDEIRRGALKPTHILAAMCVGRPGRNICVDGQTPRFCIRTPGRAPGPFGRVAVAGHGSDSTAMPESPASWAESIDSRIEVTALPLHPRAFESLVARVRLARASGGDRYVASVSADRGVVRIVISKAPSGTATTDGVLEIGLGRFPAGSLTIAVQGEAAGAATCNVTIADDGDPWSAVRPLADYSDMWWNENEPGWGISIQQHASARLVATWLSYDESGAPVWYSLQPGSWTRPCTFVGPIFRYAGPVSGQPFNASNLVAEKLGSGSLDFLDSGHGTFTYQMGAVTGSKAISRMTY